MRALLFSLAALFLFHSHSYSQEKATQGSQPGKAEALRKVLPDESDPDLETQNRLRLLAKMRREHSDANGKLRPDLFAKGAAQVQRMKVTHQLGVVPNPEPIKKP
jgi:hypothetical protein